MPDREDHKPTAEQVAWVFEQLVEHYHAGGTFRALVKRMGFQKDFAVLYQSGGQLISNLISAAHDQRAKMKQIAEQVFGKKDIEP